MSYGSPSGFYTFLSACIVNDNTTRMSGMMVLHKMSIIWDFLSTGHGKHPTGWRRIQEDTGDALVAKDQAGLGRKRMDEH